MTIYVEVIAAPPGAQEQTVTAHGDLSGHRVVMPRPEDGQVEYADAGDLRYLNGPLWMTSTAMESGANGQAVTYGEATEPSWAWAPGETLWLAANGAMTQIVPDASNALFARRVGTALTPTTIFFDPQIPIMLT
jgi:hypothetical protein